MNVHLQKKQIQKTPGGHFHLHVNGAATYQRLGDLSMGQLKWDGIVEFQ